jgi:hypothetical protein
MEMRASYLSYLGEHGILSSEESNYQRKRRSSAALPGTRCFLPLSISTTVTKKAKAPHGAGLLFKLSVPDLLGTPAKQL